MHNKADIFVLLDIKTGPEDIFCLQTRWVGASEFNSLKSNARDLKIFLKDSIAPKNVEIINALGICPL